MNCAKCAVKYQGNVNHRPRLAVRPLVKLHAVGDHDKYFCPVCRAIYFFPTDERGEQLSFNQRLTLA